MGPLGWQETVFIFVLALLIFGPKKLPELGKTIGKALTEFRRASSELKATWDREISNLEREGESIREITSGVNSELHDYTSPYTYEEGSYGSTSEDSTAASPSTVSASAPEGAEPTADAAPETSLATAEADAEGAAEAHQTMVAESGEPAAEPKPAGVAEGGLSPESQAVAS